MKKLALIISILAITGSCFFLMKESRAGGKCTGSANCSSCKNCSRCAHCRSGGSCGVCASSRSYEEPAPKINYQKRSSTHSSNTTTGSKKMPVSHTTKTKKSTAVYGRSVVAKFHKVKVASVNVRKSPSLKAEIICTLHHNKPVRILKTVDAKWVEIRAFCDDGHQVTGYIHKDLLH